MTITMRSALKRAAKSLICMLTVSVLSPLGPALACQTSAPPSTIKVSATFKVLVEHEGKPIRGVRVGVYREKPKRSRSEEDQWSEILVSPTDQDGVLIVHDLAPGQYKVQTAGPGRSHAAYIQVPRRKTRAVRGQISLEWPNSWLRVVKTKALRGDLHSSNPQQPFDQVTIQLWVPSSPSPAATQNGADGRFNFENDAPGVYILRIKAHRPDLTENWQPDGDIAVEIVPDGAGAPDFLSMSVAMTSNGLSYANCPVPMTIDLRARQIAVVDPMGAVIARAKYFIEDTQRKQLASGQTDEDGRAKIPSDLHGEAKLTLWSLGFTPLEQPLNFLPAVPDAPAMSIIMRPHSNGECSEGVPEKHAAQK
jgi:5-hydroxyisourate hydrolase-like protein (transthyretin family)